MPPQQASILIVDDELSVRDSLLHWFRKDGFSVATAASATLALQALELNPYDIILLDTPPVLTVADSVPLMGLASLWPAITFTSRVARLIRRTAPMQQGKVPSIV